jgi:hypothetical protein
MHAAARLPKVVGTVVALSSAGCTILFGTSGISDGVTPDAAVADAPSEVGEASPPLDPDLVGYWPFDEGQGTVAHDLTVQKNDGTLSGGASWIAGKKGGALAFDGVSGLVTVHASPSLRTLTGELTFATWLYLVDEALTPPGNQARIMQAVQFWDIKLNNRAPQFETSGRFAIVNWAAPLGEWHHVAFTFKTGVALTAYVDGNPVSIGTNQFTNFDPLPSAEYDFVFGGEQQNEFDCKCRLDEVRIYRRALGQEEIAALLR